MKNNKWMRFRHSVVRNIVCVLLYPYTRIKYRIRLERFRTKEKRPYLILYNHQTPFDQFFVGMSIPGRIYYLATEDIFSNGFVSSLIRWLIAPIPIKKQTADIVAIKNCIKVAREGGAIAIAPEGNRTYSGKTEYMSPTIAPLAKRLKLPIALYRIEGGYGAQPRWSDVVRKGEMRAYVSEVIEYDEYSAMTDEELLSRIERGLYVNEAVSDREFVHKKRAEYLERAVYVCPFCGLSAFESYGAETECKKCGRRVTYGTDKTLTGVGFDFPFRFVNDWYEYQMDFVRKLDLTEYTEAPMFTDTARMSEVVINKRKNKLRDSATLALYGDRIVVDEGTSDSLTFCFDEIPFVAVLGRNKLNVYTKTEVFQFKGNKRFNALKYINIFYHHKNVQKGDSDGGFLGL